MTRFEGISYLSSCWLAIFNSLLCFCSGNYGVSPPPKVWEEFFRKKAFHGDERFWANMWGAGTNDQIMPWGVFHKCIFQ